MFQCFKIAIVLITLLGTTVIAQHRAGTRQTKDIRVSTKHPSVYISFVKIGEAEPLYNGWSNQRVWLRFHNNTRWTLLLRYTGSPPEEYGEAIAYHVKTLTKEYEFVSRPQVVVIPRIPPGVNVPQPEAPAPLPKKEEPCEQLDFFSGGHLFTVNPVPSGKSVLFSVPREYLCKDNYIVVRFEYAWEPESDSVYHEVHFSGSQIPKEPN